MINVEIDQSQVRDILNKANPKYINEAVKKMIGQMGARGRALSINYLKPTNSARGTGYAQKSMRYEVKEMTATVFSLIAQRNPQRAQSIEEGRSPGEEVSARAVTRWLEGNLYVGRDWAKNRSRQEKNAIYRAQAAIKRAGARGKHFISQSREKLVNDMPKELAKIAKTVEKRWAK